MTYSPYSCELTPVIVPEREYSICVLEWRWWRSELYLSCDEPRRVSWRVVLFLIWASYLDIMGKWFLCSFSVISHPRCCFQIFLKFSCPTDVIYFFFPRNLSLRTCLWIVCKARKWNRGLGRVREGNEARRRVCYELWIIGTWFHWAPLKFLRIWLQIVNLKIVEKRIFIYWIFSSSCSCQEWSYGILRHLHFQVCRSMGTKAYKKPWGRKQAEARCWWWWYTWMKLTLAAIVAEWIFCLSCHIYQHKIVNNILSELGGW